MSGDAPCRREHSPRPGAQARRQLARSRQTATAYRAGYKGLGIAVPLLVHGVSVATGRRSRRASMFAAAATLIGGYSLRSVIVHAGRDSARRPEDYFQVTEAD